MINIVATECVPEHEAKYNRWYNEVHIPMLLKFKGLRGVTRYKITRPAAGSPTYLAVYEFDSQDAYQAFQKSPELVAVRQEMAQTWKDDKFELKYQVQYEPIKTWKR